MKLLHRFAAHVSDHPHRLLVTNVLLFVISVLVLGLTLIFSIHANHQAATQACRATNELRLELYTMAIDLGKPESIAKRLLTDLNDCEKLP